MLVDRNGKAARRLAASDSRHGGRQTDKLSLQIDQGASAAAEVQPRICLDERSILMPGDAKTIHLIEHRLRRGAAPKIADDPPGRAGATVAEAGGKGIGDRDHELALAEPSAVAELDSLQRQNLRVQHLKHRQVAAAVRRVDVGVTPLPAWKTHVDLFGVADDVEVRQDQSVRIDDDAAAERFRHVAWIRKIETAVDLPVDLFRLTEPRPLGQFIAKLIDPGDFRRGRGGQESAVRVEGAQLAGRIRGNALAEPIAINLASRHEHAGDRRFGLRDRTLHRRFKCLSVLEGFTSKYDGVKSKKADCCGREQAYHGQTPAQETMGP